MKTVITSNLLKFILTSIIVTILFRFGLSTSLTNEKKFLVITCAIIYGILMWLSGTYFGKKDHKYLPIYDVGFRFHFSTFLVHNTIAVLWFLFGFESKYENIAVVYRTVIIWSFFLTIHFIYYLYSRKSSIKGLNKKDLFE